MSDANLKRVPELDGPDDGEALEAELFRKVENEAPAGIRSG